jgi:putative membrane protein
LLVGRAGLALLLVAVASPAYAHEGRPLAPHDLWRAWELDPALTVPLALTALLYGAGVRRLWRAAAPGRGVRRREVAAFALGWATLAGALISPLHALGGVLFSAHMTQHELLMVVATPLLVLGRPLVAFIWAFPPAGRRRIASWLRWPALRSAWLAASRLAVAWWVHAAAICVWHVPALYELTLASTAAHAAQHASFVGSALLFWWALFNPGREGYGVAVGYLFGAAILTGALGALLTFAPTLWYQAYAATSGSWGLTPVDDQQLGGIIMWIPGGISYLVAGLVLFAQWLRESELRARHRERGRLAASAGSWGPA